MARIKRNSDMHKVLLETKLIIWDEVPMQHKYAADAVDRNLRDLLGNDVPFGGITIVFGGDFRQTLPIIPRGVRQQIEYSKILLIPPVPKARVKPSLFCRQSLFCSQSLFCNQLLFCSQSSFL